uniref:Uncharacterized protein n=1 Tax=Rhizophora mucronata TaxID=61149 RepID=A0A2P2NGR7_RHIMU
MHMNGYFLILNLDMLSYLMITHAGHTTLLMLVLSTITLYLITSTMFHNSSMV